jgi:hypothetical protein
MKSVGPTALVGAIFLILPLAPAHSQATRTWVSGVGDDANPCSRTAPCQTFSGAFPKTAANGIIDCLDPGSFGALTITKSITIDCEEAIGGVQVPGADGFDITTSGVVVNLRGLDINGGGTGLIGINITNAATVFVRKSVIYGFQSGGAAGISVTGGGTLVVDATVVHSNGSGIVANSSATSATVTLRDVIVHSNASNGISIAANANANIDRSTLANNGGTGLVTNGSSVVAMIGNSTITGNATGVSNSLATLYSFKDNQVGGNTANGTPIPAFPGPGGPLQ